MNYRKTLLAASIITGLCLSGALYAQDSSQTNDTGATAAAKAKAEKDKATQLATVTVVGIRDSEAESLALKKDADAHVEVVTAEAIGKLPAKNVADTLARLPGVNVSDAGGAEGGFDEADRVSLRGSAPGLTLTTVNGHMIGSGDWFVLGENSGRSVSYSLLPSEVVSEVEVYKSSEAKLLEGGAAGTVDIITRKPLEFGQDVTAQASVGGVYADLPGDTKPQFNGLFNWKNSDGTFGVMLQAFYEERSLQRDGQEMLGYSYVPATSALGTAYPSLANKFFPNLPGAALFEQTRKRKGGTIDLEWKPLDNLTLDLNGFYSKLNATDVNYNYMLWNDENVPSLTKLNSYTVVNNVITNLSAPGQAGGTPGIYDQISRPGEAESSYYITLDADWKVTKDLSFKFEGGTTKGTGETPTQNVMEMNTGVGQAMSYGLNGLGSPASWTLGGNNSANTATNELNWIFGEQDVNVTDKESWFQTDGEFDFDDAGALSSFEFGIRYSNHTRDSLTGVAQGPDCEGGVPFDWVPPSNCAAGLGSPYTAASTPAGGSYPSGFASALGVGSMPSNIWLWTPAQLAAFDAAYTNRNPITRGGGPNATDITFYSVNEKDRAAYWQANFVGGNWSGNFGLRYVGTSQNVSTTSSNAGTDYSGPYGLDNAFGTYYWNYYSKTYAKLLPSFNLKVNLNEDGSLLARFAASQTLTRQDYGQLAGPTVLSDPTTVGALGGGSASNPNLKPLISTNFDASLEWYFAPRGLVSASVFAMDLNNYYDYGATYNNFLNSTITFNRTYNPSGALVYSNYLVSMPVNVNGTIKGVELSYQQPIGDHFGVDTNLTYTNGHESGGTLMYNPDGTPASTNIAAGSRPLIGSSRETANLSFYYEDSHWNGRVSYTYRSKFYDGLVTTAGDANIPLLPYWQAGVGTLGLSAGYKLNDHVSFSFDAMNLNNPKLRYFVDGNQAGLDFGRAPEAFYTSGRQYYFNVNFKL